jgi:hypothetical protein
VVAKAGFVEGRAEGVILPEPKCIKTLAGKASAFCALRTTYLLIGVERIVPFLALHCGATIKEAGRRRL